MEAAEAARTFQASTRRRTSARNLRSPNASAVTTAMAGFLRTPERTPVFGLLRRQVYVKEGGDLLYGRLIYGRGVDLMDSIA